jgi:hypothetical protein
MYSRASALLERNLRLAASSVPQYTRLGRGIFFSRLEQRKQHLAGLRTETPRRRETAEPSSPTPRHLRRCDRQPGGIIRVHRERADDNRPKLAAYETEPRIPTPLTSCLNALGQRYVLRCKNYAAETRPYQAKEQPSGDASQYRL